MDKLDKNRLYKLYLAYIEDYCNVTFKDIPGGVEIALDMLVEVDPSKFNIASESLADMSVSYKASDDLPVACKALLAPYVRPHLVGDKKKREYEGGR